MTVRKKGMLWTASLRPVHSLDSFVAFPPAKQFAAKTNQHRREVSAGILMIAKQGVDHASRGIVHHKRGHELRPVLDQPQVMATGHLYQHSLNDPTSLPPLADQPVVNYSTRSRPISGVLGRGEQLTNATLINWCYFLTFGMGLQICAKIGQLSLRTRTLLARTVLCGERFAHLVPCTRCGQSSPAVVMHQVGHRQAVAPARRLEQRLWGELHGISQA